MTVRIWLSGIVSLIALLLAMLFWSIAPASECSTNQEISWLPGLAFFSLAVAGGSYVISVGNRPQRLAVFVATGLVVAGYVWGLTQSLPLVFATEISCAAERARPIG